MARRKLTVTQRILALLRESAADVPTPDIVAVVGRGMRHPRGAVTSLLAVLRRNGVITRRIVKLRRTKFGGGAWCWAYWRIKGR